MIQRGTDRRTLNIRMIPEKNFFNTDLVRKKIGVSVQELTAELAAGLRLGNVAGLLIGGVDKDSPAAKAGLQHGMLITSIDGQNITEIVAAAKLVYAKAKGDKVQLELLYPGSAAFLSNTVSLPRR